MNENQAKLLIKAVADRRITEEVALAYLAAALTDAQLEGILKAHKPQPAQTIVIGQNGTGTAPVWPLGPQVVPTPFTRPAPQWPPKYGDPLSPPWTPMCSTDA